LKIAIGGHAAMIAIASDEKEDSQAVPFGKCRRGRISGRANQRNRLSRRDQRTATQDNSIWNCFRAL